MPRESSQDGLLREFPRPAGRVLFAAAEGARRRPIEELGADFVPLYRTRLLQPEPPAGDVVILASGSAARAYAGVGGRAPAVTIGPETSRIARAVGLEVAAEAATHDLDGLVAAVRDVMDSLAMSVVTFLTDFGLQDDFVGTCHGVIAGIAPDVRVIDVTHGIEPQAVLQGAIVLRNTLPYLPVGVHLAVVDPGVGGRRRAVAVRARDGRTFVGPDNGLLMLAADAAGAESAHELVDPRYRLPDVSNTFHARDIFAPAAAHLAIGVEISRARACGRPSRPRPHRRARAGDRAHRRSRRQRSSSTGSGTSRPTHAASTSPRSASRRAIGSRSGSRSTATTPSSPTHSPMRDRAS